MNNSLESGFVVESIECNSCHTIQNVMVKISRHGSGGNMAFGTFTCVQCGEPFEAYTTNVVLSGPVAII